MSEMNPSHDIIEETRWRQMKALKCEGLSFAEMVPRLAEMDLVACRNCEGGVPKTRKTKSGLEICTTCEDTLTQFWRRNIPRLKAEEADILEVKSEWLDAKRFVMRTCRAEYRRCAVTRTTRTELVKIEGAKEGEPQERELVTTTEREEWRIDKGLLSLYSQTANEIAKVLGMELDEPEGDGDVPRGKINVNRPDRSAREPVN